MNTSLNELYVLSALETKEMYGLELIDYLKENGNVSLLLGSLYNLTTRLEAEGLIKSKWGNTTEERRGSRRRYYKLTALGNRTLDNYKNELMQLWNVKLQVI